MNTESSKEGHTAKGPEQVPIQIVDFTHSVFWRAGMYTTNGTLEEAGAFLEGYYSGIWKCCQHEEALQEAKYWAEFFKWLAEKIGGVSPPSWSNVIRKLRQLYPDDADAFDKLRVWYPEFLESKNKAA